MAEAGLGASKEGEDKNHDERTKKSPRLRAQHAPNTRRHEVGSSVRTQDAPGSRSQKRHACAPPYSPERRRGAHARRLGPAAEASFRPFRLGPLLLFGFGGCCARRRRAGRGALRRPSHNNKWWWWGHKTPLPPRDEEAAPTTTSRKERAQAVTSARRTSPTTVRGRHPGRVCVVQHRPPHASAAAPFQEPERALLPFCALRPLLSYRRAVAALSFFRRSGWIGGKSVGGPPLVGWGGRRQPAPPPPSRMQARRQDKSKHNQVSTRNDQFLSKGTGRRWRCLCAWSRHVLRPACTRAGAGPKKGGTQKPRPSLLPTKIDGQLSQPQPHLKHAINLIYICAYVMKK